MFFFLVVLFFGQNENVGEDVSDDVLVFGSDDDYAIIFGTQDLLNFLGGGCFWQDDDFVVGEIFSDCLCDCVEGGLAQVLVFGRVEVSLWFGVGR